MSTIEFIGKHKWINVTQLSEALGITKGAASQMVSRLVQRRLVKKIKVRGRKKETYLELTPRGRKAFDGHEAFHRDMYLDFLKYAEKVSNKDFRKFKEIFTMMEHHLDLYAGKLT